MSRRRFWERPDVQRVGVLSLTVMFWAAWLYLIMPLLSLLLWVAGYQLFYEQMVVRGGDVALLGELRHYGLVTLAILLGLLLWIDWNQRRYGRHNHRTVQPQPVTAVDLAGHAGLVAEQVIALQSTRQALVNFDEQDRMRIVQVRD